MFPDMLSARGRLTRCSAANAAFALVFEVCT